MTPGTRVRLASLPEGHRSVNHVGRTGTVKSIHHCVVAGEVLATVVLFGTCTDAARTVVVPVTAVEAVAVGCDVWKDDPYYYDNQGRPRSDPQFKVRP